MNSDDKAIPNDPPSQSVDLPDIGSRERYDTLLEVVRNRVTVRKFDENFVVPDSHYNLILEAARHAPSGANAQPWHFIIVEDVETKRKIADYFVSEQRFRAKAKMKFPTPDYRGLSTAPGFIVVCSDMRWVDAFPVMKEETADNAELNRMYRENAERILLQSVAASTMSAHLAAASLGYCVWWVTAIGQENAQKAMRPLLGIPEDISVLDLFLFGPPAQSPYKRWKKSMAEISSCGRFDSAQYLSREEIREWIKTRRHKAMYRDAARID